jgi:hypothetical protein
MNQAQPPPPWWKDNRLVWALIALAGLVIITILGYLLNWKWIELIWRWLELLIIPVVLAVGAFWFNQKAREGERQQRENELKIANQQRQNELELADQHRREEALQRYLDRMSELILDKDLRESKRDAAVRAAARARTLTVLRSLDGNRKGQVARFLYESGLIGGIFFP